MEKLKKLDYAKTLILAAMGVTVVRYIGAFVASDVGQIDGWVSDVISIFMGISGIGMGVLDVLGTAFIFEGWRAQIPRRGDKIPNRFWVLSVFALLTAVTSLFILTPFTVSRVSHQSIETVLGGPLSNNLSFWSLMVNLAPLLIIGGVMTSSSKISLASQDAPGKVPGGSQNSKEGVKKYKCKHCPETFNTLGELGNHVKYAHKDRKDASKQ